MKLEHLLERTLRIAASRATVFRYFTDSARFAAWWGTGSTIEPRPGGRLHIRYPNGVVAGGEVLEIEPGERIVFTYGYESGEPIAIGSTRVTITLADESEATRLTLVHELADAAARDAHVPGWQHQLGVFANVVAREAHADAEERIDRFFALWAESDPASLAGGLAELVSEGFAFRDQHACLEGREDFAGHVLAVQRFFPGGSVARAGDVQHCQGTALAPWTAAGPDGRSLGTGTNVFRFASDGRMVDAVGLWDAPVQG